MIVPFVGDHAADRNLSGAGLAGSDQGARPPEGFKDLLAGVGACDLDGRRHHAHDPSSISPEPCRVGAGWRRPDDRRYGKVHGSADADEDGSPVTIGLMPWVFRVTQGLSQWLAGEVAHECHRRGQLSKFLAAIKCWTLTASRLPRSMAAKPRPTRT
jgi:hypothetical protein